MKRTFGLLLLVLLLVTALPTAAKGRFTRVIISGGALDEPITVTDPFALTFLSLGMLENLRVSGTVEAPADAAESGYELERQWEDGNGDTQTFDHVRYHSNVNADEPGYVYIAEVLLGTSNYEGKWFPASAAGDAAFRAVLAGESVACPVTPIDESSGQPLYPGDSLQLLPLKFDGLDAAVDDTPTDEQPANVAGTVLVDNAVRGNFWMDITWLDGAAFTPIRFGGTTDWQNHLELERIERQADEQTVYEWEAAFDEPGCYSVYVWAGSDGMTIYYEVDES